MKTYICKVTEDLTRPSDNYILKIYELFANRFIMGDNSRGSVIRKDCFIIITEDEEWGLFETLKGNAKQYVPGIDIQQLTEKRNNVLDTHTNSYIDSGVAKMKIIAEQMDFIKSMSVTTGKKCILKK